MGGLPPHPILGVSPTLAPGATRPSPLLLLSLPPLLPEPPRPTAEALLSVWFQPGTTARQRALVRRLYEVATRALADETLTMERLADGVGLSRATLYRRLATVLVGSPGHLLLEIRLSRATALLTEGSGSIGEIAFAVGFRGPSHFAARFRERYGVTPSSFASAATARRAEDDRRDASDEERDGGDEP